MTDGDANVVGQGAWPNHIGTFGQLQVGALHLAAIKGHADMCELLVRLGADVNLKNDHGLSPLHMACQLGPPPLHQPPPPPFSRTNLS